MSKKALVLQHGTTAPPGLLGEWAQARGIELEVHHTYTDAPWPQLHSDYAFLACLGSKHSPSMADEVPVVRETLDFTQAAVEAEIPVLGLCYGGQVLAAIAGSVTVPSPEPQFGWHQLQTNDPSLVPEGPWLEWHYERFTLPSGATEIASSGDTVQAFTLGKHLGTQFHPESTIEIVSNWARHDQPRIAELGIEDGVALLESGRAHAAKARENAFHLFDAFLERAQSFAA